jgi:serine/threonine protein kinase
MFASLIGVPSRRSTRYSRLISTLILQLRNSHTDQVLGTVSFKLIEQVYARKVIRVSGDFTLEDVQNELRAVDKLRKYGSHKNIVKVFQQGELLPMSHYFIDMELCDMNLQTYIDRQPTLRLALDPVTTESVAGLFELSPEMKLGLIWCIMADITNGLIFVHAHSEVHRDLKPRNGIFDQIHGTYMPLVLYSSRRHAWKIADFGFSAEGTSEFPRSSVLARGTPGYRPPELATFRHKEFVHQ